MKTTKPAVILLTLVLLLTTAVAQPAEEKPAKKEISDTQTASCLFKITTDEAILPLNEFAVDYLLHSSGVAGKAAREVLDISPDLASELFEIEEIYSIDSDSAGGMGLSPGTAGGLGVYTAPMPGKIVPKSTRTRAVPGRRTTIPTTSLTPRPPTRPTPTVTQPLPSTTEQTILFRLQVGLANETKPAAEEFMMALIDNLRSALSGAFDQYSDKLNNQLRLAGEEAQRAEIDLVQMQAKLREISGSRDLSRNVILRDISNLRQKLQTNMMDMASYKSAIEATTKRIAETKAEINAKLANDAVTSELQKMLLIHEERIKRLGNKGAPEPETTVARENLAKARIELAKRREELSKSVGGNLLSTLNQVLADASLQESETMGQISNLQRQIGEAEQLLSSADEYELLSLKADIARQNLEETLLWRARLGRNIRSIQPPDVTVIGAE
jgi:hypothetical protein